MFYYKRNATIRQLCRSLSTATTTNETIAGTAPYHEAIVFLHTRFPPVTYPKVVPSKLQKTLQLYATQWSGLVNFAWSPEQTVHAKYIHSNIPEWDAGEAEETYRATAFSKYRGRLELPEVSFRTLEEVGELLKAHASPIDSPNRPNWRDELLHLYVCTHNERDCRCGTTGVQVFEALREEVARRNLTNQVKVAGTGHVGGHKYAANLLVYPEGDWLGYLRTEHVGEVLDAILTQHANGAHSRLPLYLHHWRGRIGLDKEEQKALASHG